MPLMVSVHGPALMVFNPIFTEICPNHFVCLKKKERLATLQNPHFPTVIVAFKNNKMPEIDKAPWIDTVKHLLIFAQHITYWRSYITCTHCSSCQNLGHSLGPRAPQWLIQSTPGSLEVITHVCTNINPRIEKTNSWNTKADIFPEVAWQNVLRILESTTKPT